MSLRPLHLGLTAALLVAVAVIVVRRGDHGDVPPPATIPVQRAAQNPPPAPEPAVQESPISVGQGPAATVERRPSPSPGVSRGAPRSSSVAQELTIPTEVPDSPGLEKELGRDGTVPDYREVYTYQLGLMAFYRDCMKGRIARGVIYYFIKWQVDEASHLASSPFFDRADVPVEGTGTPEDEVAFAACVKEYLATHDRVKLPHGGPNGEAWGMRAVFPLSDSPLLKMIAAAKARSAH